MSAKPGKKSASKSAAPTSAASQPPRSIGAGAAAMAASGAPPTEPVAWIDSNDPRRRMIGKVVLVGVWIYVAALWLLALDQTFNWGIFGPKLPVTP